MEGDFFCQVLKIIFMYLVSLSCLLERLLEVLKILIACPRLSAPSDPSPLTESLEQAKYEIKVFTFESDVMCLRLQHTFRGVSRPSNVARPV